METILKHPDMRLLVISTAFYLWYLPRMSWVGSHMNFLAFAGVQGQLLCEHCEPYSDGPIGTDAGSKGEGFWKMWRVGRLAQSSWKEACQVGTVMSWVECLVRGRLCPVVLAKISQVIVISYESRSNRLPDHFSIQGVFICQICAPPKAITRDHTRQSIKLGVNHANTVMHIHRTGKTDERNSTCGPLFPAVSISYSIELARSVALFLSFVRSFVCSFLFFFVFSPSLSLWLRGLAITCDNR